MGLSSHPNDAINGTGNSSAAAAKDITAATRRCADLLEEVCQQHEELLVAYADLERKYSALNKSCNCGAAAAVSSGTLPGTRHSGCLIMLDDTLPEPQASPASSLIDTHAAPPPEAQASANGDSDLFAASESASKTNTGSYVLVLVDARSHCFKLNQINAGQSGGDMARRLLMTAITAFINSSHRKFQKCRIKTLVVADTQSLVESVKKGYPDTDTRRRYALNRIVNHFADGFRGQDTRFITIDINDNATVESEVADFLEKAIIEPSCEQVYFAASGHECYVRVLQSMPSIRSKVTLISNSASNTETSGLGLITIKFPEVFHIQHGKGRLANKGKAGAGAHEVSSLNRHCAPEARDMEPGCQGSDNAETSQVKSQLHETRRKIPVNSSGHRLDPPLRCPTKYQMDQFYVILRGPDSGRPCAAFHVGGFCKSPTPCVYSHEPISPEMLHISRYNLRRISCKFGGLCRGANCMYGHHCVWDACLHGKQGKCGFKTDRHNIDTKIDRWVEAVGAKEQCGSSPSLPDRTSATSTPESDPSTTLQPWNESDDMDLIEL